MESVISPEHSNSFYDGDSRSNTNFFRDDLREWLASHEPVTLLEQQEWTQTWNDQMINCDDSTTITPALTWRSATGSQGSDFKQVLVQYFFDNLCCIHSVLDDTAESFKALVRRYLGSSPLLHISIVCMSAAHCFRDEKSMLTMCLEYHSAAVRSLLQAVFQIEALMERPTDSLGNFVPPESNTLRKLEETLLASLILGFCAVSTPPQPLLFGQGFGKLALSCFWVHYFFKSVCLKLTFRSLGPILETLRYHTFVVRENCVNPCSNT